MNAQQYVRNHAVRNYYHGFHWNEEKQRYIGDKWNYGFIAGKEFTEEEIDLIDSGELLQDQINHAAARLVTGLEINARRQFLDWEVPIQKYSFEVEFDDVVCYITFTHKKNGVCLCLNEVYFDMISGEINQCILSFQGKRR